MRVTDQEREFSVHIMELRKSGELGQAVQACNEAIKFFPRSNFFFKIKGDILYDLSRYDEAVYAYLLFLERIKEKPEYFTNFTRFIGKVHAKTAINKNVLEKLSEMIVNEEYPYIIRSGLLKIVLDLFQPSEELLLKIEECNRNYVIETIKPEYEHVLKIGKCETIVFLCSIKKDIYLKKDHGVNRFVLKRLELENLYEPAVRLINKMLEYSNDFVDVSALFRICRKRNDYTEAVFYMSKRDIVHEKEFHIQYELVWFFDSIGDEESRNQALAYLDELSAGRIPVCRALFKFYLKYNMIKQAKEVQERIFSYNNNINENNKKKHAKADRVNKETQDVIWERLQTLVSEQEHNRQLIAITELIKGFSHELGQPVTNIRYAIQLYNKKNRKFHIEIRDEEQKLLDNILIQPQRVGKLLNRFAPITSSQSQKEYFSAVEAIRSVFDEMSVRLLHENIEYQIIGNAEEKIYGEILQFSQVFYNLIINAIYAIQKKGNKGWIKVEQNVEDQRLMIVFSDNGIGIPPDLHRKIFEPFFSTKKKELEEGGEGLGLFIVWNILKMFHGRIYVDAAYQEGARFILEFYKETETNV